MPTKLNKIFDSYSKNNIFKDKFVLQTKYKPDNISHRDDQIKKVASILAPALRGERTSNLFVYGQTGTGKTLSINYVRREMMRRAKKNSIPLDIKYLNCKLKKVADTEYRILAEIIKKLGSEVPATGLPTDKVYSKFVDLAEEQEKLIILILDEIDHVVRKISDEFLYNLTRLNSELNKSQLSIIGISNELNFLENLDPRVRSSLSEEELIFPPYNAIQLKNILKERSNRAFKGKVLKDGVIQKCAAYAAQEHGDARRALDLLRIAGELAEREGKKDVELEDVDNANKKIDRDKVLEIIDTAPKQFQITFLSIILLNDDKDIDKFFTGDVYNLYTELCVKSKTENLTQRRISDIIAEIDMLGLINAKVISKGRYGRTRKIKLSIPSSVSQKAKTSLYDKLDIQI